MERLSYDYIIVGAGLAGASAVAGIREIDSNGSILLLGSENRLPYDRPPLTKSLWSGRKGLPDIFIYNSKFYEKNGVELRLNSPAARLDLSAKLIYTEEGKIFSFGKLLLAAGGQPRRFIFSGNASSEVIWYRYLSDFEKLREKIGIQGRVAVIGGGFIGSELAASLCGYGAQVALLFTENHLCARVFPKELGAAVTEEYIRRGVYIMNNQRVNAISRDGNDIMIETSMGIVRADAVVAGFGIEPEVNMALYAGLKIDGGILVDNHLKTSHPDIYAAGDCANFPYDVLGKRVRMEHWDNALNQGTTAGRNMAGANETYLHMPYFFSDLFEFGYEAVGDINSANVTVADWKERYRAGIIYYLDSFSRVTGVMACGIYGRMEEGRELIRSGMRLDPQSAVFPLNLN
ncbi:MAG: FAD-dependent oxidoreductase [Chitinispirillales bacterium]|jgi:NADPH-dependent 2,4-dienoyl-CoA reductase/sulfur reductase-like enzyme|nr:FAD-dependent oxidoreductase [Chitinispirillales bacterium]